MSRKLLVGNLPWSFTSADLKRVFSSYGAVQSAEILADRFTGQPLGVGSVVMESPQGFQHAREALNESVLRTYFLEVRESQE